jgi:hypothetical protein
MFAELGRKADAALTRGTDALHEAAHATVLHARRIVGAVAGAAIRVRRETQDLAWDYQDVAGDLRQKREPAPEQVQVQTPEDGKPRLRVVGSDE